MTIKELITYLTEKADGDLDMEIKFEYFESSDDYDYDRKMLSIRGIGQELSEYTKGTPQLVVYIE